MTTTRLKRESDINVAPERVKPVRGRLSRLQRGIIALFLVLGVIAVVLLSTMVWQQLFNLRTASKDNAQWLISQLEIEILQFQSAVKSESLSPEPDLKKVRRRFDLFYSRIGLVTEGYMIDVLRNPEDIKCVNRISDFAEKTLPLIDGPSADLVAALPELSLALEGVYEESRNLSLSVVRTLAEMEQERRDRLRKLLSAIAFLVTGLFLVLVASLAVIVWLYRLSERRTVDLNRAVVRQRATIGATVDAVFLLDEDCSILEYGGAAERMFGYRLPEVIGCDIGTLAIQAEDMDAFRERLKLVAPSGLDAAKSEGSRQIWGRRKSGEKFPIEVSAEFADISDKRLLVVFIRDVSEVYYNRQKLIAARDTAKQAEEEKSRFIAVMSHEMRTPLNGIIGAVEILRNTDLSQKQSRFIEILQQSGQRLLMQVNRVLDISRIESGKIDISPRWFDPAEFASQLIESNRHLADGRGNKLLVRGADELPAEVFADDDILAHVVSNVLSNAIKFTEGGLVTLEMGLVPTGAETGLFTVAVQDNGIGIAAENREKVFEDFISLNRKSQGYQEGAGLGLGIARRLTAALDGQIRLDESHSPGSRFVLDVPVALRAITAATDGAATPHAGGKGAQMGKVSAPLRVLVADDDEINRMILQEYLTQMGHDVHLAVDGKDCVSKAAAGDIDVILMDFGMPELDGITATKRILGLELNPGPRIIGITADINEARHATAIKAGMAFCLTKPVTPAALAEALLPLSQNGSFDGQFGGAGEANNPTEGVLDEPALDQLEDMIGKDNLIGLITRFINEANAAIVDLRNSDPHERLEIAHKKAGSAGAVGARQLREAMLQIEGLSEHDDPALADLLGELPAIVAETTSAFVARLPDLDQKLSAPAGEAEN